jgi:hypothetical protein
MKDSQAPVSLNELLDRLLISPFNSALVFPLRCTLLSRFVSRSVSNAGIERLPANSTKPTGVKHDKSHAIGQSARMTC